MLQQKTMESMQQEQIAESNLVLVLIKAMAQEDLIMVLEDLIMPQEDLIMVQEDLIKIMPREDLNKVMVQNQISEISSLAQDQGQGLVQTLDLDLILDLAHIQDQEDVEMLVIFCQYMEEI